MRHCLKNNLVKKKYLVHCSEDSALIFVPVISTIFLYKFLHYITTSHFPNPSTSMNGWRCMAMKKGWLKICFPSPHRAILVEGDCSFTGHVTEFPAFSLRDGSCV